ncbi:MAG TPA: MinD/ParA family protein [Firmicutes bacterium]|nr:MinD/ParA family protein [Bacillota bacterium]
MPDQAQRLRQLVQEWERRRKKRTIAITSGKGGVGKTNIAANLALALHEQGYAVTLLDADLGLANLDVVLGITPPYTLGQVVQRECSLIDIVHCAYGVKVVAGGSGLEELATLPDSELLYLFHDAAQIDSDFFLIDTGAGISPKVTSVALAAQEVVVVTTPEPTALTDAYALIKVLTRKNANLTLHLVVNRASNKKEAQQVTSNFCRVAKDFLSVTVNPLGYIPEDRLLRSAVHRQQPLLLSFPSAPAAEQLRVIAASLAGTVCPSVYGSGLRGFLGRLRSLFR